MSEPFVIWQTHLASRLGVTIEELREARKTLSEGVDYDTIKNRVLFSQKGAQALAATFGVNLSIQPKLLGNGAVVDDWQGFQSDSLEKYKNNHNGSNGEKKALPFLIHRKTANPNIMEAYPPGSDPAVRSNLVRIRVKATHNFMRGMKVEALPCAAQGLYEFTGRLPRWPGKY